MGLNMLRTCDRPPTQITQNLPKNMAILGNFGEMSFLGKFTQKYAKNMPKIWVIWAYFGQYAHICMNFSGSWKNPENRQKCQFGIFLGKIWQNFGKILAKVTHIEFPICPPGLSQVYAQIGPVLKTLFL